MANPTSDHDEARLPVRPIVDGIEVDSESESTVSVVNPSNGQQLMLVPAGCDADVDRAVLSSRRAFDDGRWSEAAPSYRKSALRRLADLIAAESASLDALDAEEMGKPIGVTLGNAAAASGLLHFYAEAIDKVTGDVYGSDKGSFVAQRRVPRGVVAAVTPWNFPTINAMRKLAPALAAGNCVVLKPSELASRTALSLARFALKAGVPPGVFNVVPGLGKTVGRALGLHMGVDMMTFTGSTDIGKKMVEYSGQSNMKVVIAECGGKSPQIVFDDGVNLDAACESISRFILTNQGQICSVGSRVLVQKSIEENLIEKLATCFGKVVVGDARDPRTTFGPVVSANQCARVVSYIESAKADGAQLVTGGARALPESGGYFIQPTLFRDVSPTAKIAQEEIFGPVLSVTPFESDSEAIELANGTKYGLAAYVWTASLSRGMAMARAIRSSVVVNTAAPVGEGAGHAASSEPVGLSGIGVETGIAGLESYLRRQLTWFNYI